MTAPLGAGVIGLGVGERHAHAYVGNENCRLVGVCDFDPAKLTDVATRLPPVRQYATAEDLIDDPAIAIVSIASYDQHHHRQVTRALETGKHVFVEKPLCLTMTELDDIRTAWRRAGNLRLSTNTILRRTPRFQWLRQAIQSGEMGKVFCIEADYVYGRLHKLTEGWRKDVPNYSVILGGGIHLVDLVLWMTGQKPVEIMAYGSSLASRDTAYSGNDLALALLRFDNGMLVKLGANFGSVHPHFHRLIVYGTSATFENAAEAPGLPARLWTSRDPNTPPSLVEASYPGVGKGDMIPAFVEATLGRGEPEVSEDDLFTTMTVCLAIDQAIAEGRPVTPEYNP